MAQSYDQNFDFSAEHCGFTAAGLVDVIKPKDGVPFSFTTGTAPFSSLKRCSELIRTIRVFFFFRRICLMPSLVQGRLNSERTFSAMVKKLIIPMISFAAEITYKREIVRVPSLSQAKDVAAFHEMVLHRRIISRVAAWR